MHVSATKSTNRPTKKTFPAVVWRISWPPLALRATPAARPGAGWEYDQFKIALAAKDSQVLRKKTNRRRCLQLRFSLCGQLQWLFRWVVDGAREFFRNNLRALASKHHKRITFVSYFLAIVKVNCTAQGGHHVFSRSFLLLLFFLLFFVFSSSSTSSRSRGDVCSRSAVGGGLSQYVAVIYNWHTRAAFVHLSSLGPLEGRILCCLMSPGTT